MHRLFLFITLLGVGLLFQVASFPGLRPLFAATSGQQQPVSVTDNASPLPGGCGHVTPPGQPERVCCISGYVYLDGKPIAGVKIIMQETKTLSRRMTAVYTEKYTDEDKPYYRLDLTAAPLGIQPGDTVRISAEYGDYKKTFTYIVKPNGQQYDIVLPRVTTSAYQFDRQVEATPLDALDFNQINGVATDSSGNVYVLDKENARVVVFDAEGKPLRQWGRFGSGPGQFRTPSAIAVDKRQNYVYVADTTPISNDHFRPISRLQKFSLSGILLGQLDNRLPSQPLPTSIGGMVVDADENIYITGNTTVRKINFAGQILKEWGNAGSGQGQFNHASGLAFDSVGNLYVVDSGNQRIQKFTSAGEFILQWGGPNNEDGHFLNPQGITLDNNNNVYVVDSGNQRLQKFASDGTFITKWGNDLFGFKDPTAIAFGNERVYIADAGNHQIQSFTLTGQTPLTWGQAGAVTCYFNPGDIAVNSQGVLRVLNGFDGDHEEIRCMNQFQPDGKQLGDLSIMHGYTAITSDASDNLYAVLAIDTGHYLVSKFDNAGNNLFNKDILGHNSGISGFVVDSNGKMYVSGATTSNQEQIDILDSTGTWQTAWNHYGNTNQSFIDISELALDKTNNLYVAQSNDQGVKLNSAGALLGTFDHGPEVNYVQGLAVDANDHIFVTDLEGSFRIQELSNTDQFIGGWNPPPGDPTNSDSYVPTQIVVDHTNQIYVIEQGGGTFYGDGILKVYRPMTFTLPIATINYRSQGNSMLRSETLDLYGMGQVSDAKSQIATYQWALDGNPLSEATDTLHIAAGQLGVGDHTITFAVQDNQGRESAPVNVHITVLDDDTPTPVGTTTPSPTLTPEPSTTPTSPAAQKWTFLLYLDGDYNDSGQLSQRFESVIRQFQQRNLPANVNLAIQVDGQNNGDSKRFLFKHDNQGNTIAETADVNSTNEAAMDNPYTLTAFVIWGQGQFTDTHYYLAIADHGQALSGIAWDYTSDIRDNGVADFSAHLTVKKVGQALHATGVKPLDILHLDACSMNLLEAAYELKDVAGILISSQYLAWDYFSYPAYVAGIGENTQPVALAAKIVNTYADTVERDNHPYTISALNLQRVGAADLALSALITELNTVQQSGKVTVTTLTEIRNASQTFESDGDYLNRPDDLYVDLKDWLQRLRTQVTAGAVSTQSDELLAVLTGNDPLILHTRSHTDTLPERYADGRLVNLQDAHGLSIFYPRDKSNQAFEQYVGNQLFSFTTNSAWRTFLNGHTVLPSGPIAPPPGPSKILESGGQIFLPLILR